ncbi:GGDEF domain-containing protein [Paenibacillus sp. YYML68]|uniref:GGDEF domain-containing protein n=1 Tax=Paenibacillus sp. YYML68 TaxID=2909250 RepID=UPI00249181DD|nr:GGDEF domain-containing protein [Paenibacillus sp. YYML68]
MGKLGGFSPFVKLHIGLIGYVLIFGLVLLLGDEDTRRVASNVLAAGGSITAAVIVLASLRGMHNRRDRMAWTCFAISLVWYSIYDMCWRWNDYLIWKTGIDYGMVKEIYFLGVPLFLFAGLLVYLYKMSVPHLMENLFDLLFAAAVVLYLDWTYFLYPVFQLETFQELLQVSGMMVYSLTATFAIFGLIYFILSRWQKGTIHIQLLYLTVGAVAGKIENYFYYYMFLNETFTSGHVLDVLWTINLFLIALSGYITKERSMAAVLHRSPSHARVSNSVFSYALTIVLLLAFLLSRPQLDAFTVGIFIVFGLMLLRQLFSVIENTRLVRKLEKANEHISSKNLQLEEAMVGLKQLHAEADRLAKSDFLTSLYNRRHMMTLLHSQVTAAINSRKPVSLILLDIDYFKSINDTYGHECGDFVLQQAAQLLQGAVVESEAAVGRYGGEEFLIVLSDCAEERAAVIAERIRAAIAGTFLHYQEQRLHMTASLGVTGYRSPETVDEWIRRADELLYEAKAQGRNSVSTSASGKK